MLNKRNKPNRGHIVLAAGGTGGHIFPAEAIQGELERAGFSTALFTDHRYFRYRKEPDAGKEKVANRVIITSAALMGNLWKKMQAIVLLAIGLLQSLYALQRKRPLLVIGFGGYPAFPILLAARLMQLPIILHEQNMTSGKVTAMMARYAEAVFVPMADLAQYPEAWRHKCVVTGIPVRQEFIDVRKTRYPRLTKKSSLQLLVVGGSQGASVFSTVVPQAFALLSREERERFVVTQQCPEKDLGMARAAYDSMHMTVEVEPFFRDMAQRMQTAHVLITRAGASTIAEICMVGRPALYIPYPFAIHQHQRRNAQCIVASHGGWVMDQNQFTPDQLAHTLQQWLDSPTLLAQTAAEAKALGTPDSVSRVVAWIENYNVGTL
jgi:UDP-N-acetylglucosamine--N-acetylmuramyl-(pentapeptide) pyrophosphoryl-undecaprenol N-acetylglucosamine transferase